MEFSRWIPLADAASMAPAGAGAFQVRVATGLLAYPRGKSAMVHYAAAADMPQAVAAFAAAHRDRPWLVRFAINMTAAERRDPEAAMAALVARFQARFGAPPGFPETP
ncbi:MAG TPA: hypothetical protein VFG83_13705 [Kofleriaceae bacterium]|nr:hypothetical protein [Kofleriaceae bacterium]